MKRLFIIGASVLQIPAIKKAKELDLFVGVVDMNPRALGIEFADKFYEVSTIDIEGVIEAAKDFKPDGVLTIATDMPIRSVAAVAGIFGLQGISTEVAIKATDKLAMIRCFENNNVPSPWYYAVSSEEDFNKLIKIISPPFIIKPSDSSGSRGVILINSPDKAMDGFRYSKSVSRSGVVLVEEYMKGPEVSVEIITVGGQSAVLAVTDKLTTGAPFFVEMGHSQPSSLSPETIKEIEEVSMKAVKALGIDNSPSHVEIIVTASGPKLVELGARLGGDCITTHLVPLSTGIDMVKASIKLALGEIPEIDSGIKKGAAIRYINSGEGILMDIPGLDKAWKIEGVKHIEIVKQIGDSVKTIHGSGDRLGYVIAQSETSSKAVKICEEALKSLDVKII